MDQPQHPPPHHVARSDELDRPKLPLIGFSLTTLAAIFVGGGLGTVSRYLLDEHSHVASGGLPWVTLTINLSGSLAIGLLIPLTDQVSARAPWARPLVVVGFLGGWTTYSTLAVDSVLLAKGGDVVTMVLYLAATVIGGLLLVVAGHAVGRRLVPSP